MFLELFRKECTQVGKSLIYWLYVICLVVFFSSQLGSMKNNMTAAPKEGEADYRSYGSKEDVTEEEIMHSALGHLAWGYYSDHFTTYPIGYAKDIRLSEDEKQEIKDVVSQITGLKANEVDPYLQRYFESTAEMQAGAADTNTQTVEKEELDLSPKKDLSYKEFLGQMERVTDILGPGSEFTEAQMRAKTKIPVDYKGAVKAYENLVEKDRYTGGYARLFCDYMGIMLGILPVFVAATRMLRDRRAQMQDLVYVRRISSTTLIWSRFAALAAMMFVPVILLSVFPTINCMMFMKGSGIRLDYLAFLKYDFGWLLPTLLVSAAVGTFFTELTDTALAVLIQGGLWFFNLQTGVAGIEGGQYGWNLIPRHNTELNYHSFAQGFSQLAMNRIFYTVLAVLLVFATVWVYERKRKGHLRRRGKILRNRKKPAEA